MPYTAKQHRLFEAAAHNPKIAKKKGIKQSDAKKMASEGIKPGDWHRILTQKKKK